jgi:tetratricopeptide (TPR) repeat protein
MNTNQNDGNDKDASKKHKLEWERMYDEIKNNNNNTGKVTFEPSPLFISSEEEMMLHESSTKEALQSLLYDEDEPNESAENFKTQGNSLLQKALKANNKGKFVDVMRYYDQAMECQITDLFLKAQILCNRAQVHLLMGNYGHAMEDAKQCIKELKTLLDMNIQPSESENEKSNPNVLTEEKRKKIEDLKLKALFRVAKAAMTVKKYKLAIQYCERALASKPSEQVSNEFEKLHLAAINGLQQKFEEREKQRTVSRERSELPSKIKQLLEDHGIRIGEAEIDSNHFNQLISEHNEQITGHPSGIQISEEDNMPVFHFRVILIYDEFNQTDIIQDFSENDTFDDHLAYMFPPEGPPFPYAPNDPTAAKRYVNGNLAVAFYDQSSVKTTTDTYYKVNTKDTLGKILQHPKYRLPSGLMPIFHVSPLDSPLSKTWKELQ